jgi:hypothetical protein
VQQSGVDQLADHEGHATGRVELVHVGLAVRIDARQQRHAVGQRAKVLPVDRDAGGARDRDEVDRVVGRSAGGMQADDGVDDRALVDDAPIGV